MAISPTNEGAAKPTAPSPAAQGGVSWVSKLIGVKGPLTGLVVLCIIFSFTTSAFLSFRNLLNIVDQVTVLGIIAIGMTAVIVIGGNDLSVGSVLAFSMILGYLSHDWGLPLLLAVLLALLVGALCGWVNGMLITRAKLPAFIATLSMMTIARGLATIITDGRQIVGYPDWFDSFATFRYFAFLSLACEGMAVVVVTSDLEEVIGLANRVLVLARGIPQGTLKHGDATNVSIMELATRLTRHSRGGARA